MGRGIAYCSALHGASTTCLLTCHACTIQSARVGGGGALPTTYCLLLTAHYLLLTAYCLLLTAYCLLRVLLTACTAYCLLHRSEEAELSTGRRRSLKVTPGWRKASLGAPEPGPEPTEPGPGPEPRTRTLTLSLAITLTLAPNPNPNPNQGERGGECVCGSPRLGAPEQHRVPGQRRGSECGRSTQMQRRGVLLPSVPTPTPTPTPNTHRPHTNPYPH